MKFCKVIFLFFFVYQFPCFAQFGGWASYSFLKLPSDAYTTSLGGQSVAPIQSDPSLYLNNPALNDSINKHYVKINYAPLWSGTNTSTISYGRHFEKIGNISASLQYLNYGNFQGTDPAGNITNTFTASDFALTLGHMQKVNNISIGVNLKFVGSSIDTYNAYALLVDFGGYFKHPKKEIAYGLVIKNMGVRLKNFTPNNNQPLPFDVQMAFCIRPEQMPLRFSINAHHIYQWNILIDKPTETNIINNQIIKKENTLTNKIASHLIFGVEAFIYKNFQLNFGYNHLLRRELKLESQFTLSGFSFGFLLKSKKINFSAGHQGFTTAGGLNQLSVFMPLK